MAPLGLGRFPQFYSIDMAHAELAGSETGKGENGGRPLAEAAFRSSAPPCRAIVRACSEGGAGKCRGLTAAEG
eukprot:scaffold922_cov327-Pinguiococcus_pyrenoidosus.AAC.16